MDFNAKVPALLSKWKAPLAIEKAVKLIAKMPGEPFQPDSQGPQVLIRLVLCFRLVMFCLICLVCLVLFCQS